MCQLAWPSTGNTTARPRKSGREPTISAAAMIAAHAIIVTGFVSTAFTDVMIAAGALTSRSRRSGKDTTLIAKVKSAKRNPIPNSDDRQALAFLSFEDLMDKPA